MLAGAAKEYSEEMDAKKQQAADILLAQQKYLMESGIAKLTAIKKGRKESQARIDKAKSFEFDSKAALALEMSGELDSVITRLTKIKEADGKDVDGQSVARMSQAILENVPPEKLAQAMEYAIDSGAAEEVTAEKLINAIFSATTSEELGLVSQSVSDISGGEGLPSVGPFGLNLLSLTELGEERTQKARNLIEDRLKDSLGRTLTPNGYVFDEPTEANRIIEKALDYYVERRGDPLLQVDIADVTSEISQKLDSLIQQNINLNTIANDYDFSMNPSDFNPNPQPTGPQPTGPNNSTTTPSNQSDEQTINDNNLG